MLTYPCHGSALQKGYSLPAQIKLLEDYAALNGIVVVSSHVDVETARNSSRTAFGNMLRYLKRHPEVGIILVEKTDRLYRNLKDWAIIDDLGVEVHFVKENVVMSDDCRSPAQRRRVACPAVRR